MITKVKELAKRDLEGKFLYAIIALLVLYLINSAAGSIPQYVMMPAMMENLEALQNADYLSPEAFLNEMLVTMIPMFVITFVVAIVMGIFVNSVLQLGYVKFSLNLSTTGDKAIEAVFDGFKDGLYLKRVKVMFIVGLYVFLWLLPVIGIQALFIIFMGFDEAMMPVLILLTFAYMFFFYSRVLNYMFVPYLLMDATVHYETVAEYIQSSKEMIAGSKWTAVGLAFSFILWFLLIPFTLGFIMLYVYPYMYQSFTRFYLEHKEKTSLNY